MVLPFVVTLVNIVSILNFDVPAKDCLLIEDFTTGG